MEKEMNIYEVQARLAKELGKPLHLNFADKKRTFNEEEYQNFKQSFVELVQRHLEKETSK